MCKQDGDNVIIDGKEYPDPLLVAVELIKDKEYDEAFEIINPWLMPLIMEDLQAMLTDVDETEEGAL